MHDETPLRNGDSFSLNIIGTYTLWLMGSIHQNPLWLVEYLGKLYGKDLGCSLCSFMI